MFWHVTIRKVKRMRQYRAIKNAVSFGKGKKKMSKTDRAIVEVLSNPVSEMQLVTPRRNTKWLERGWIYEVVSEVDSFGYYKIREPRDIGGVVRFIHKNNMKKVRVV